MGIFQAFAHFSKLLFNIPVSEAHMRLIRVLESGNVIGTGPSVIFLSSGDLQ